MKNQMLTITFQITQWEQTARFIRPASQDKPTWKGAARMVADDLGVKPSAVSVHRIETAMFA